MPRCTSWTLVEQGLLRKKVGSVLGLVKSDRYPTVDPVPEREVRKELLATLEANESASPPEMSALIGCIGMIGRAQHVVAEDLALGEAKSIKRRAQEYMNATGVPGRRARRTRPTAR